jgi:polysaccharide chain length determinant protein (PEP-CTERM system associated)
MSTILILARRIAIAAWRYRWAAVALSWIVCGAGWAYVYTIPNTYEASARLYVDADSVLTPLLRGIAVDNSLASQLDVLQRTLLSRPNLEKLVSNTDLDLRITGPSDLETMVSQLATQIHIVPQTRNLFTITYRNTSPKLAFDVVQTILTTFIESKTGNNRSEMENAQLFLQQQLASYERQLRDAEKKRADFRAKYVDLLPVGDSGINRLDEQKSVVRALQGQLDDALAKQALLKRELASTSPLIATETEAIAAAGGVAALVPKDPRVEAAQHELDDLLLRDTDSHPDVIAARARLAAAKAEAARNLAAIPRPAPPPTAAKMPTSLPGAAPGAAPGAVPGAAPPGMRNTRSLPNPVYEQLKVQLVESDSAVASLQRQVADATRERDRLDAMARSAPGVQAQYLNLNRDYDVLRKNYEELLSRRESMRIATAAASNADQVKIQVIDPPQVPQNPVAPKRAQLLSAVLAVGLIAGAALAVLLVQFDQSFHTIDELRDLGLPVAGGVSLLNMSVSRGRLAAVVAFGLSLAMLGVVYAGLFYKFMHTPGLS